MKPDGAEGYTWAPIELNEPHEETTVYAFKGPGLHSHHWPRVRVRTEFDAKRIVSMLEAAFEAGRIDKAREVCAVLGVERRPR